METEAATTSRGPAFVLLHDGRSFEVPSHGLAIGRGEGNDVQLRDPAASRRHAILRLASDGIRLEDCGSTNGTFVNGDLVRAETRILRPGDVLQVGEEILRLGLPEETAVSPSTEAPADDAMWRLRVGDEPLTIGRDPVNAVVLDDLNVSRRHAEVRPDGDGYVVRDLGSRNGTWIGGRRIQRRRVGSGTELRVGRFRIVLEPEELAARDERGAARLVVDGVSVRADGRAILAPASLQLRGGELLAIIGRSGSGKTTLLSTMAGVATPDAGTVTLNGDPVSERLTEVGYLPQDEIVHPQLTVAEALTYAARLRLPRDVPSDEIRHRIAATLQDLNLADRAHTRIGRLSGGERRRAGLAVELLGRPDVLLLDEPTTGLDPGLEGQTMTLLRRLAGEGRAVAVVTHATNSLDLCDRVAVLAPGGRLRFVGSPQELLRRFGVEAFEDVYDAVERADTAEAAGARLDGARAVAATARPRPRIGALRQSGVLIRRYLRILVRDRRNLAILLGQVPILGAAIGALFDADVFARNRQGNPNDAAQVLFLLSTTALWLGAIASAREIVKERAVLARERAVGVRLAAYLLSKSTVLFTLAALQAAAVTAVVVSIRPLHARTETYLEVLAIAVGTGVVAAALGLVVSALARSQDQATSFVPLVLVPQLLFAGALVPASKMGDVVSGIAAAMPSRWSFAGLGTAVDLPARLRADPYDARYSPFERSFFDVSLGETLVVFLAFVAVFAAIAALALRRRA